MNKNDNNGRPSLSDIIKKLSSMEDEIDRKVHDNIIDFFTTILDGIPTETETKTAKEPKAAEQQEKDGTDIEELTYMELPMDWENPFDADERTRDVHADSIPDGLILSLSNLGKVDIEYISAITGEDYKTVISALKGSIYQNPETWNECFYMGWETAEEYLSGNLIRKLNAAKKTDEIYKGWFSDNIAAIEKVLPEPVGADDIYVTLGSPWVPPDIIDDFILHLFGSVSRYRLMSRRREEFHTLHDELTGAWEIPFKTRYGKGVKVTERYGTARMNALHILERTLNMKSVVINDEVSCPTNKSGKKLVINKEETILAAEKQKKLTEAFQKWVWTDDDRKKRLEKIFEEKYGCVRRRIFDGSFLTFPGLSPDIKLYPYQKDAAARILFTQNTLLAHDVGSGKTYIMIAAGMELLRMGLSKKNMYVVPNNIVGQWKSIFETMYPNANIFCVEPKNFIPGKREKILEKIRDEEFDAIIIAYSSFELIPLSKEYYREQIIEEQNAIEELVSQKNKATSRLTKKKNALKKALHELNKAIDDLYDGIYFDELGVTHLFVDEAHNFKNVPIETKADKVLGINAAGSKKCRDMMDKVHLVQKQNGGRGVTLATGTPVTNSVTDVYIMQKYLQSGELAMLDLQNFDSWIGMFAEKVTGFEIDVDTSSYRLATRFSKFHNLPELTALLSSIADFHRADSPDIPETDGYTDILLSRTDEFAEYLKDISHRAEMVRNRVVSKREDNMLKITTDGRKAALDLRLVIPGALFTYNSKATRCAENTADIYYNTTDIKSTQLIFCDTSTPKQGFNIYSELKRLLTLRGVPEKEIAFIHDAETETKRNALFKKMRSGEIRILIGSTFKLGLGVNIQDRLIALHHIDIPWRPADMIQREGRILRQGNMNPKVKIFRYITEGSFDAYSWQLLETKASFIAGLLSGCVTERSADDIEGTVLDYAEVKALAVGNPLVKERVEIANMLSRQMALQRKITENHLRLESELAKLPNKIKNQERFIDCCRRDAEYYAEWELENPPPEDKTGKEREVFERKNVRERLHEALFGHILEAREEKLMNYRGFDIILPVNMTKEMPFVYLERTGKYYVDLGESEIGNLIRIDNFLHELDNFLDKQAAELGILEERQKQIKEELSKNDGGADLIETYMNKLRDIDKKLGVDKK